MTGALCPHCNDANIQHTEPDDLVCWKCGWRVTREELGMGISEEQIARIRELREKGFKLSEIEREVGVSQPTISKYLKKPVFDVNGPPEGEDAVSKVKPEPKVVKAAVKGSGNKITLFLDEEILHRETIVNTLNYEIGVLRRAKDLLA